MMKTAIVIGATGLVGKALVQNLIAGSAFSKILVFARRSLTIQHERLEVHIIDFDAPESWQHLVRGDVLFSALGTTLQQAGGKNNQYKVDYSYQYGFAEAAADNSVPVYVLVSSSGADPKSMIFYSRMKGELDEQVSKLSFTSINILRPGLLTGERQHARAGEQIGYRILTALNAVGLLKKYQPVPGSIVARAMINAALKAMPGIHIHTLNQVFTLAGAEGADE